MAYTSKYTGEQIDALLDVVGGTETSSMEYLDVSGADNNTLVIAKQCASLVKWESTNSSNAGRITIAPLGLLSPGSSNGQETAIYMAVAIDLAQLIVSPAMGATEPTPLSSFIGSMLASLPRITKEEFYTI